MSRGKLKKERGTNQQTAKDAYCNTPSDPSCHQVVKLYSKPQEESKVKDGDWIMDPVDVYGVKAAKNLKPPLTG